jgi:zinc-ribbon domain
MFCPKCAAQNQDQTNFCRNCGTDLKTIAMVLNGQLTLSPEISNTVEKKAELTQQQLKLQSEGGPRVVQGAILFVMGSLLGVPLYLFGAGADWHENWILVWLVLCGWLPVWGAIAMGSGVTNMIHSRMMRHRIDRLAAALAPIAGDLSRDTQRIADTSVSPEVPTPLSVSEHTTGQLIKPQPRVIEKFLNHEK